MAASLQPKSNLAFTGFCAILVGIGLGRFAYPSLIPALIENHWFSPAQADYLGATNLAGYIFGSITAARVSRHFRLPTILRISMVVAVLNFICCAYPLGFVWFLFWRLAAGIVGGYLMVLAVPTIIALTPVESRGKVGGFIFMGPGVGMALSGTIIPQLVAWNLSAAWIGMGVLSALLAIYSWNHWPEEPEGLSQKNSVVTGRSNASLLTPAIFILMAAYGTNAIGFVPHTVFWVDYIARGLGLGLTVGGHYWILLGICAAVGPLLTGLMADRFGFRKSMRWSLFVKAFGVALPIFSHEPWALTLSSIGVGSMAMGVVSLASGRVSEMVPISEQKRVWGWMTMAFATLHAATAYALSYLFAATGSYQLLFTIGAVFLLFGCGLDYVSSVFKVGEKGSARL